MSRNQPSRADQDLIRELTARGIQVSATQLERWRSGGYLPRNSREGLGRGAGSRSEVPLGVVDYVEALASQARRGTSIHRTMLMLFMAGVLQPESCPSHDPLMETYESAIRRAFQQEIDRPNTAWNRVSALAESSGKDQQAAEDEAFAEADKIARKHARNRLRVENLSAGLAGRPPRARHELRRRDEQALLSATGLMPPAFQEDEDGRTFDEIWDTGVMPLDAPIFIQPDCSVCKARFTHFPTSPQGCRDILNSVCFCELNKARAIGGATCQLIFSMRALALKDPANQLLRDFVTLCSNTAFRFMFREVPKVASSSPESIVRCTLFFLQDCRWLRSAAGLLTQFAVWSMPSANRDPTIPAMFHRAFTETRSRANFIHLLPGSVDILLAADGIVVATELLESTYRQLGLQLSEFSQRPDIETVSYGYKLNGLKCAAACPHA